MPIPENINREHIFRAIIRVINEGIPPHRNFINRALEYDGKHYPIKLIISWANVYPNHEELDANSNNFTTDSGQTYLEALGFTIVHL